MVSTTVFVFAQSFAKFLQKKLKYLFIENISPFLIGSNPQANSSRRLRYPINDMNGTG